MSTFVARQVYPYAYGDGALLCVRRCSVGDTQDKVSVSAHDAPPLLRTFRLHNADGFVIASVTRDASDQSELTFPAHKGPPVVAVYVSSMLHDAGTPAPAPDPASFTPIAETRAE